MTTGPKKKKLVAATTFTASSTNASALRRATELAESFKMLGNVNRLKIVVFLDECERSVSEIEAALSIRQPTLSQQLGELRGAGLIKGRKAAKSVIYSLTEGRGRRALETVYLSNGSLAPCARPPVPGFSQQAAVFASVLSTRGSQTTGWHPGLKSLLQE